MMEYLEKQKLTNKTEMIIKTIKCDRCAEEINEYNYLYIIRECKKSKCKPRTIKFRKRLADFVDKSPDDFVAIEKGSIIEYKEEGTVYSPVLQDITKPDAWDDERMLCF